MTLFIYFFIEILYNISKGGIILQEKVIYLERQLALTKNWVKRLYLRWKIKKLERK